MKLHPRLDANHNEIVSALRTAGASVQSLASIGGGCLDLLVGVRGVTTVMEIKDGNKPPSKKRLTTDEQRWYDAWNGSKFIVYSVDQALQILSSL